MSIFGAKIATPEVSSKIADYLSKLHEIEKDRTPEGRLILSAFDLAVSAAPLSADDRFYGLARKAVIDARRLIETAVDGGYLDAPEPYIEDAERAP